MGTFPHPLQLSRQYVFRMLCIGFTKANYLFANVKMISCTDGFVFRKNNKKVT